VRTNLLLGTAAVGVLITGAIAQTNSGIERIKDAAGYSKNLSSSGESHKGGTPQASQNAAPPQQGAQPKKNVRTVYPNTQNAEQAVRESKSAQGAAEASRRQPGDVAPLSNIQSSSDQANTQASPPAQTPKQNEQAPSAQAAPASTTQQSTSAPSTHSAESVSPSTQPATAPPPAAQQPAPSATAEQSNPPASAPQSSTGVIALDTQQQTSIGQAIAHHNVKPITNVTFSMALGTKVPASVQLRALPSDVATFVPQYRGYSYFVVEEQMVIVDPATQAIVAIVPYTASTVATRAAEPAPAAHAVETHPAKSREAKATKRHPRPIAQKPMVSRSVNLSTEDKGEARRSVTEQRKTTRSLSKRESREREPVVHDYRERAPRTVTVEEQDEPLYREVVPRPRGFFDFLRGDDDGWR
jgi:hypothetical protein